MPRGLRRYHESGHSHFVIFSCYRRQPNFSSGEIYDLFTGCLELGAPGSAISWPNLGVTGIAGEHGVGSTSCHADFGGITNPVIRTS